MTFSDEELAALKSARDAQLEQAFSILLDNMVTVRGGVGTDEGALQKFQMDVDLIRLAWRKVNYGG